MIKSEFQDLLKKVEKEENKHIQSILLESSIEDNIKSISLIFAKINKDFIEINNGLNSSKESLLFNSSKLFYYLYLLSKKHGAIRNIDLNSFKDCVFLELEKNQSKGDFSSWIPNNYELSAEINYHLAKLYKSLLDYNNRSRLDLVNDEISEFSYDVCNYIIKIMQLYS